MSGFHPLRTLGLDQNTVRFAPIADMYLEIITGVYGSRENQAIGALLLLLRPELKEDLQSVQLMARVVALEWFEEGKIRLAVFETFEDRLYKYYM